MVLSTVLERSHSFTAEQLVAESRRSSRSTIYRTLEILASLDILARLLQPGGHPALHRWITGTPPPLGLFPVRLGCGIHTLSS